MKNIIKYIITIFWKLWFYIYVDNKLKRKAKNRYRIVQKSDIKYELQCYQIIQVTSHLGNTGYPKYKWTPLLVHLNDASKNGYINECKLLRNAQYKKYRAEYLSKINEFSKPKYPKIIF